MIRSMGNTEYFEDVRDHFQSTVPQLFNILDDRHCILYLRNMLMTFRQTSQIKQRSVWCFIDSELDKERSIWRCMSRKHREAKNLLRSSQSSKEGKQKKGHRTILDRFLNSPRYRTSPNRHRMGRRFLQPLRLDCSRRSILHRDAGRPEQKWKFWEACTSGKNGPMDQQDDYQEAERTHEEHGKRNTRLHPKDLVRQRRSQQLTGTEDGSERVDPKTGLEVDRQVLHPQLGEQHHGGNLHHGMSDGGIWWQM